MRRRVTSRWPVGTEGVGGRRARRRRACRGTSCARCWSGWTWPLSSAAVVSAARPTCATGTRSVGCTSWSGRLEVSCALASLGPAQATGEQLAELLRRHWEIEDRMHYVRDFSYDEDRCRVYVRDLPRNLACLTKHRHLDHPRPAPIPLRAGGQPAFRGTPAGGSRLAAETALALARANARPACCRATPCEAYHHRCGAPVQSTAPGSANPRRAPPEQGHATPARAFPSRTKSDPTPSDESHPDQDVYLGIDQTRMTNGYSIWQTAKLSA